MGKRDFRRCHRFAALALGAWCAVAAVAPVHALPDDHNQPIYIQSDRAERDERKGTTVYTGDVEVDQGSLHISADRVVIHSDDDQVNQMEAFGEPARMQQKTSVEKEPVYARAKSILYVVSSEELTLTGDASVTQEGAKMTGAQIIYYMREQRVKAGGLGASAGQTRVQTVIPPRQAAPNKPAADAAKPSPAAAPDAQTPTEPSKNGTP